MTRDLRVNRMRVSVCGMVTILLLTLLAAHAGAVAAEDWRVEGKDVTYIGDEATATLPRDHEWQVMLREYLKTLAAEDFTIEDYAWDTGKSYDDVDLENLYRDWIVLDGGGCPSRHQLFAEPALFTLEKIERKDGVYMFVESAGMTWWTRLSVPGNPFFENQAAEKRALVCAVVDMIMLETSWLNEFEKKPDFMSANLGIWAYTYSHAGRLMPLGVQEAFKQGMRYYLTVMEELAPRDINTNMDMREIVTLAELDKAFSDDPQMHPRLVRDARRILFGEASRGPDNSLPDPGTFHPAGYIGEMDGPETSYNGISLLHLLEAATTVRGDPDWDAFMPEVIDRMLRFKAYNTFPEPWGGCDGPSSWAKRTNNPYSHDQRNRPWRKFASAMMSEHGLYLLGVDPEGFSGDGPGFASPHVLRQDVKAGIARLASEQKRLTERRAEFEPAKWAPGHWPEDIPFTWDNYVDGSYRRFARLVEEKSELLLPPFQRGGDFSIGFDDEFWMAKDGGWGFQVEAVPDMGGGYDSGGSGALAGGSLAAFWTRDTGSVLLGRLPAKFNYVTWTTEDNPWAVHTWPTHHLWGRTAEDVAFSSARQRTPRVQFELDRDRPRVQVAGQLGQGRTVEPGGVLKSAGVLGYRREFEKRENGLHVTSELVCSDDPGPADQLVELVETLPVFLNPARADQSQDTEIEILVEQRWQPGLADTVSNVEAVRLRRFHGSIVIEFDRPRLVRLSEVIKTEYQKKDRLRVLHIDLLENGGEPVPIPRRAGVSYLIRVAG